MKSEYHARRAAMFLRVALREGDPEQRRRLIQRVNYERGQVKLYRMVERRGSKKPIR